LVGQGLQGLKGALGAAVQDVQIAPLPGRLSEISRGMDVLVEAPSSPALPMRCQGMGARSLAAAMVFRSFAQARLRTSGDAEQMALTAFEEPEAHLHPQAHGAMFDVIAAIPGQKIISTHSPYVVARADLDNVRVMRRTGDAISIASLQTPLSGHDLAPEDMANLRRFVQREHGDILFARAVVLYEGETEEGALPVFALDHWKVSAQAYGVSLVACSGAGNFKHFVRGAEAFGIPWLLFADGDESGAKEVTAAGQAIDRVLDRTSPEVVMLPDGVDFEAYLVMAGCRASIERAIETVEGAGFLEGQRQHLHSQLGPGGVPRDYHSAGWEDRLVLDLCRRRKSSYGRAIAGYVCETGSVPPEVARLFQQVDRTLDL
jgi:putative ATP-dependent endonuclease of the OLD family